MPIPITSLKRSRSISLPMPVVMTNNQIEQMTNEKTPQFKSSVLKKKRDSPEEVGTVFVR
jgi:hypothetical protein